MGSPEAALELVDVHAEYGARRVLQGVDLTLLPGEIVAMLGHNGAGKTTALRIAAGLKSPSRGTVGLFGRDIGRMTTSARARAGLSLVPKALEESFPP